MANKKSRIWLVMLAMLLLAGWITLLHFSLPYIGINLSLVKDKWTVTGLDPESWASHKGVQVGDVLSEIDHKPLNNDHLTVYSGIGSARNISLIRGGEILHFDFSNARNQPISFNQTVIPMALFILLFTFSSFIIYKKPEDRSAFLLIMFLMSIAIGYLAAGGNARDDVSSGFIMKISLTFAPVFFLHFLHSYFSRLGIYVVHRWAVYGNYVIVSLWNLFIVVQVYDVFSFLQESISKSKAVLVVFIVGMLFASLVQVRMFIRYRNTKHQALLKYMMMGNMGAFLPLIVTVLIPFFFGNEVVGAGVAGSFLMLLPLTYLYLVVSNKLLDIDFIMSRLRYYCMIALLPTLIIVGGIGLTFMERTIHTVQWLQMIFVVYSTSVLALYAKEMLDRKFRNKVIKGAHEFEKSLESFSNRVSNVMRVHELEQCLANELFRLLQIPSAGFIERNMETNSIRLKWSQGPIPFETLLPQLENSLSRLSVGKCTFTNPGTCYMIGHGRGTQHFVWIGDKTTNTEFNHDEKVWLRTIITYVGFVYQNLQLIEGLVQDLDTKKQDEEAPPWVLRLLFRLSEKERRKLASDLHDSALQDQLVWYRKLEAITNDDTRLPEATRTELDDIREGLLDVIHQIRETCNELRPPFLQEMGAIEAIENLCAHAQLNANYTVTFNHQDFRVEMDDEYVLTIYRITQELLRNGMKHSKATNVELSLHYENNQIRYCYQDNGVGMEMDRLQSSFQHMGLSGIRERVSGLEGETYFRTAPGEGLLVQILLPLPEEDSLDYRGSKEETA